MTEQKKITLELSPESVQFILTVLGDLPTKTGAWVLLNDLLAQTKAPKNTEE